MRMMIFNDLYKNIDFRFFNFECESYSSKETGMDQTRRYSNVETIRDTDPSELASSWPISQNPLERVWTQ